MKCFIGVIILLLVACHYEEPYSDIEQRDLYSSHILSPDNLRELRFVGVHITPNENSERARELSSFGLKIIDYILQMDYAGYLDFSSNPIQEDIGTMSVYNTLSFLGQMFLFRGESEDGKFFSNMELIVLTKYRNDLQLQREETEFAIRLTMGTGTEVIIYNILDDSHDPLNVFNRFVGT